jgi:integrase
VRELVLAEWTELDWDQGVWTIPREHTKNKREHTVCLSPFALSKFKVLRELRRDDPRDHSDTDTPHDIPAGDNYLFPNPANTGHLGVKSITKQILDRQRSVPLKGRSKAINTLILSGGTWTPHDLRRTGATVMTSLGIAPETVERCLNHEEQNHVKRIYQRHGYVEEQKAAWIALGERLEVLLGGDRKVMPLKKGNAVSRPAPEHIQRSGS